MTLQQEVNEEIRGGFATGRVIVMKELERLDAAVKNVYSTIQMLPLDIPAGNKGGFQITEGSEQAEQIRQPVQELQQSADLLSQGLDPLTKQFKSFFRLFSKGEMLCLIASGFLEIATCKLEMNSLKSEQMELNRDRSCIFMSFWLLDGFLFTPSPSNYPDPPMIRNVR